MVKGKAGIYYGEKLVVVIEEGKERSRFSSTRASILISHLTMLLLSMTIGSYFGEIGCIMVS